MDTTKLYEILSETAVQLRKGDIVETEEKGGLEVKHVYAMPHEDEADRLEKVDMHFIVVDKEKAEARRAELLDILRDYPEPDRLAAGPSYLEIGGVIGDQGAAFMLFALGKVLGLWDVISPASLGIDGALAQQMAGTGYIMITGYQQAA